MKNPNLAPNMRQLQAYDAEYLSAIIGMLVADGVTQFSAQLVGDTWVLSHPALREEPDEDLAA